MTQEDKQLLLADLCARLPYGVFCVGITYELDDDGEKYIPVKVKNTLTEIHNYKLETAYVRLGLISSCELETVKPYLRPMSSMTDEEIDMMWNISENYSEAEGSSKITDLLNKWNLDHHHLIERGLAIAVTEENNPYK
jgi:hypothetical protein